MADPMSSYLLCDRAMTAQSQLMLAQLRYAGLLEVCRIRKLGYPIRRDFDAFLKRYVGKGRAPRSS